MFYDLAQWTSVSEGIARSESSRRLAEDIAQKLESLPGLLEERR